MGYLSYKRLCCPPCPQPACSTPVQAGLVVETDSPKVRTGVRGVLALMQSNHPADCLTCDANERCEFQVSISLSFFSSPVVHASNNWYMDIVVCGHGTSWLFVGGTLGASR